jgi:hypothetical protein
MPGLIVLTRAPRLPHRTASAITRSALGNDIAEFLKHQRGAAQIDLEDCAR